MLLLHTGDCCLCLVCFRVLLGWLFVWSFGLVGGCVDLLLLVLGLVSCSSLLLFGFVF